MFDTPTQLVAMGRRTKGSPECSREVEDRQAGHFSHPIEPDILAEVRVDVFAYMVRQPGREATTIGS